MTWLLTLVGGVLIAVALRDIFQTLWHPRGFGSLSRLLFRVLWRGAKLLGGDRRLGAVGPLGLAVTAAVWAGLLVVGFALIYLPHLPSGFNFSSELQPSSSPDPLTAVYLSLVALGTLGLGDITPALPALRLVVPVQALLGFVLFTAAISWVLQLYPALSRRRALARRLDTMARMGTADTLTSAEPSVATQLLEGIRESLAAVEMDLLQYGESYYFRDAQPDLSLATGLVHAVTLVEAGENAPSREVRHAAALLGQGLDELVALLRRDFVQGESRDDTLAAYAADHGWSRTAGRMSRP